MAVMDMTAPTANIEARIVAERKRLFDEQALQVELEKQRLIPLEQGNDEVLDEIEQKIAKSIERAERVQERIALLENRLTESKSLDESARLDELAASAERVRDEGEKIIRTEYVKAAKTLASVLAKLRDNDELIATANTELERAKRPTIASANNIRCRPPELFVWTERKSLLLAILHIPVLAKYKCLEADCRQHRLHTVRSDLANQSNRLK